MRRVGDGLHNTKSRERRAQVGVASRWLGRRIQQMDSQHATQRQPVQEAHRPSEARIAACFVWRDEKIEPQLQSTISEHQSILFQEWKHRKRGQRRKPPACAPMSFVAHRRPHRTDKGTQLVRTSLRRVLALPEATLGVAAAARTSRALERKTKKMPAPRTRRRTASPPRLVGGRASASTAAGLRESPRCTARVARTSRAACSA